MKLSDRRSGGLLIEENADSFVQRTVTVPAKLIDDLVFFDAAFIERLGECDPEDSVGQRDCIVVVLQGKAPFHLSVTAL